ncbi:MAG: SdrD B-like domain-containing protein [Pyrinomonadaceae bacterium]
MKVITILSYLIVLCLTLTTVSPAFADGPDVTDPAQTGFYPIVVNGRVLTGPNTAAQSRNGQMLIPVASVARAFGDTAVIDAATRRVTVERQTGVSAAFDGRVGQVSENGAVILSVSNSTAIAFAANADEMMLPIEIAAALFDTSIRFDTALNKVIIGRGRNGSAILDRPDGRSAIEIYQADFDYNLSRYTGTLSQNLVLRSTGRIADGRFHFTSNSSGSSFRQFSPRTFIFDLERQNGQRFVAGDFGSGQALPLMTALVRGGLASIPVGKFTVGAFGGRANSGSPQIIVSDDPLLIPPPVRPRFDTTAFGFFVSNVDARSTGTQPLTLAAGAMRFNGRSRTGDLFSTSTNYVGTKVRVQADLGLGNFAGFTSDGLRSQGFGTAMDVTATFQAADNLSVYGRYAHVGRNFLGPQAGIREPIDLKAAGLSWSPVKWLTTSFNASTAKRPTEPGRADSFVTAAFSITPGAGKPRFYFAHTESSSRLIKSGQFTIFNASKDLRRVRLFLNASRIKNLGPATVNAQFGANYQINDRNSIEATQGVGSRENYNGLIDWRTAGLLKNRLNLTAGAGYNHSPGAKFAPYERLTASLVLPRESSLQVNYIHTKHGSTLLIQLRGTIFRKREAATFMNALPTEVNNFGTVMGRVYQDIDGNGSFDEGVDKPQASVKVRVDGNRYVETDENGNYSFEAIAAGDHKIYLDLLSVRADLTLLDGDSRDILLKGGRESSLDFRLVRTGRLTGRVWHDQNENGKFDSGETPLADIRIVTASGRDTLTDADGYFTIADLAPGEHTVFIDEKTLPEKTTAASKPSVVRIFAGRETNDVKMLVVDEIAEVKHFGKKVGK